MPSRARISLEALLAYGATFVYGCLVFALYFVRDADGLFPWTFFFGAATILVCGHYGLGPSAAKPQSFLAGIADRCQLALVLVLMLLTLIFPAQQNVRSAAARRELEERLKLIGRAMHEYYDANNKRLPAHAIYSKDGTTPLLSWRVTLLPYLGHRELYEQFRLEEPWDSPHNLPLAAKMPEVYAMPWAFDDRKSRDTTYCQVFVGPGAAFDGKKGVSFSEFTDGTSNTALVVLGQEPVCWTRPADLTFSVQGPLPKLRGLPTPCTPVLFADGSVQFVPTALTQEDLRVDIKEVLCHASLSQTWFLAP